MHTRAIAKFAAELRLENVPSEVISRAKAITLDGIGCGIYAAHLPWTEILVKVIGKGEPNGTATLWGRRETVSPASAALINGTMVQGFELDDIHIGGSLHSGAAVIPAALSAAEHVGGVRGERVLAGIIAGYEIGPRVGLCMRNQQMLLRGWHSGAVVSTFPAAVAAGVVAGLNSEQMMHALGIAATQSAGLMSAQYGSMVKRMHHGRSSQSGLYAALLASEGFTGIEDVFELPYGGFCKTFSNSEDNFDLDKLTEGLGQEWETMSIAMKPYACMGGNHAAIDAIKQIAVEAAITPDDIAEITVGVVQAMVHHAFWDYKPNGLTAAQMHLGFAVAMQMIEGDVFVEQMTEGNTSRPDLVALARKVVVVRSTERENRGPQFRWGCDMTVRLTDGRVIEKTVDFATGSRQNPLDLANLQKKYRRLAINSLPEENVLAVEEGVLAIDRLQTLDNLMLRLQG